MESAPATRQPLTAAESERPLESGTYSIREAAKRLGIGDAYAYRLARADELPVPVVHVGNLMRVRRAELDAWLNGSA